MAGTVTITRSKTPLDPHKKGRVSLEVISIAWVADAADGSVPSTVVEDVRGELIRLVTNPGAPVPTPLYDITLVDGDGFDVLDSGGLNRSATVTEEAALSMATGIARPVDGSDLTFALTGNIVNSAQGVARLYVRQPGA